MKTSGPYCLIRGRKEDRAEDLFEFSVLSFCNGKVLLLQKSPLVRRRTPRVSPDH
ncbi:hypothetical protein CLOSTHATH_02341 [Hungatella hathewayi DSM 13479]|uniref:Uncharacterized protein n=1 Tax=Hungatella hathewayi DSM 13479 TaxID=566550 RepID=D3AFF7_9FIRM|nr:hypothetical protein CLOSTHATH_02341 [Hungatella hathewayi DSM 13479]